MNYCKHGHELNKDTIYDHFDGKVITHYCKVCKRLAFKKHKQSNKQKIKDRLKNWKQDNRTKVKTYQKEYDLRRHYGITLEEYNAVLKEQDYKCAVCRVLLDKPHQDHSHESNKVRGILCQDCNLGLGRFKDNTMILMAAIEYLNKWENQ